MREPESSINAKKITEIRSEVVDLANIHKGFLKTHNFLPFTTSWIPKSNALMRILFLFRSPRLCASDTSPKWIDGEGLGKRPTGTRQMFSQELIWSGEICYTNIVVSGLILKMRSEDTLLEIRRISLRFIQLYGNIFSNLNTRNLSH